MKRVTNECVGCKDLGLPCIGNSCQYKNVTRFYCDRCEEEHTLYHYDSEELCADCLLKEFEVVEDSDD